VEEMVGEEKEIFCSNVEDGEAELGAVADTAVVLEELEPVVSTG
jgi:hypothetical protein